MSTKPVDVFMSGSSGADSCPISVETLFGGMLLGYFQEMDEHDLADRTDISYNGFVGEIADVEVILDVGPNSIIATVSDGEGGSWVIELSGEFLDAHKS